MRDKQPCTRNTESTTRLSVPSGANNLPLRPSLRNYRDLTIASISAERGPTSKQYKLTAPFMPRALLVLCFTLEFYFICRYVPRLGWKFDNSATFFLLRYVTVRRGYGSWNHAKFVGHYGTLHSDSYRPDLVAWTDSGRLSVMRVYLVVTNRASGLVPSTVMLVD